MSCVVTESGVRFVKMRGAGEGLELQTFRFDLKALLADFQGRTPLSKVWEDFWPSPRITYDLTKKNWYGQAFPLQGKVEINQKMMDSPARFVQALTHELSHLDSTARRQDRRGRTEWHGPAFYERVASVMDALYSFRIENTTFFSAAYRVRKWKMYQFDEWLAQHERVERLADTYTTYEGASPIDGFSSI